MHPAQQLKIFSKRSQRDGSRTVVGSWYENISMRKEPCIKIAGTEENVKKAREMLLERMEVQSNRVVMKMEVTHLEHPSLIGKGGKLIKKVMETTGCHIHFPDANKSSVFEKNQVSIYGDPINVERARVMIRALIPIQIYFEIPKMKVVETNGLSPIHPGFDCLPPESKFLGNFNGLFLYSAPGHKCNIVIIRCTQDQFPSRRKVITMLMELICCTNGANLPSVHMVTDIMQQNHTFVKGNKNSNIEEIQKRTGAKIIFNDQNCSKSERRSVTMIGSLDSVYMAWQEIMNFLPVSVSFDINATRETNGEYMDFLRDLGIILFSRPNPKYYIKNVTLKGPEKFSKQMLQYRQHLLHLPSLCFKADIEDINLASDFLSTLNDYFQSAVINSIPASVSNFTNRNIGYDTLQQLTQALNSTVARNPPVRKSIPSGSLLINGTMINNDQFTEKSFYNSGTEDYKLQPETFRQLLEQSNKTLSPGKASPNDGCYWKSSLVENSNTQEHMLSNNNWIKNIPYENAMRVERTHGQPTNKQSNESSELCQSVFLKDENGDIALAEDYYRKKVMAARAMRRPIESMESAQVPTSLWAGYGFSQSMPAAVIKDSLDSANQYSHFQFNSCSSNSSSEDSESWENVVMKDYRDGDIWSNKKEATFSHSNYFDFLRNMHLPYDSTTKDILPELLWQRGLHKYIDTFTKEEIDFQTFLLLTDDDLQTMGIPHQARVKLVCLIRELQETRMQCKTFDAAPGAERKSSFDRLDNQQIC
ncbi:protein bicaudal C homolog 1 [Caerostris extrusa]|uniref:Protein bicaudal C homolog 1 n=1 Tax=Caerostris extrusa TaxID=172846 RepID=A0AAV4TR17_CAEEX|nr:protein bicaudal C homolog 1 [Caerostris extrusa]